MRTSLQRKITVILSGGVLVGLLDGLAAVVNHKLAGGSNPIIIFQFIASGLIGARSFSGGLATATLGIFLHFLIATVFMAIYFVLFPRIHALINNKVVNGIIYGVLVWLIMNLLILPMFFPEAEFNARAAIIGILIHVLFVGLPISFVTSAFYIGKRLVVKG